MLQKSSSPISDKAASPLERAELLGLYRKLLLARYSESRIREEYFKDEMKTPVHLGIGQEAIAVGVCHLLPPGSRVFGTYRNHALYLAWTGDTDGFFGELYGRQTGPGKGKAGSMHLSLPEKGLMATSAVVASTVPVAVGTALAHRYQDRQAWTAVFFGDGAVEEGAFWESVNFACLHHLRILFVCEDNGLAIHTPANQRQGFRSIPEALAGFRCQVMEADGSDLLHVVERTRQLMHRMEEQDQPGLLHATYFRFLEHVGPLEDFDKGYRRRPTSEERERLDPLNRYEKWILQQGISPDDLSGIREEVRSRIGRSLQAAQAAPFPAPSELQSDLYAEPGPSVPEASPQGPRSEPQALGTPSISFRDALALALRREMEADPSVFVFGLDVPDHKRIFGSTAGLLERFGPTRCFGTPLSEEGMTGVALGAAIAGLRPVHVHIRADFMLLGMNQLVNMVSNLRYMSGGKLRIPLVIRAIIGRGWGQSAQHSKSLHGIFAHIPGLKVVVPATPQDAYGLLRSAVRDDNPVIVLEHRWLYDVVGEVDEGRTVPIGPPEVIRSGDDVTVLCTSWMNVEAMKAAEILARRDVQVEVVNVRTVAPMDKGPLVDSVRRTGRCIVADYDWIFCGFSAELAATISHDCFGRLKAPVERLGFAPVPCPTTRPLENLFYPSAPHIVRSVERLLGLPEADLSGESFYSYEQRFKGPF